MSDSGHAQTGLGVRGGKTEYGLKVLKGVEERAAQVFLNLTRKNASELVRFGQRSSHRLFVPPERHDWKCVKVE